MAGYEMIWEILNECPNNQMRDVFIREVDTDDPDAYVRNAVQDPAAQIEREALSDGSLVFHVNSSGLLQKFSFTPDD